MAELDRAASAGLGLDAFAQLLTELVRERARCEQVVLLVPDRSGDHLIAEPARRSGDPLERPLSARGPMATWLRVNERAFATRDGDIWDDLSEHEQHALHAGAIQVVLPLVSHEALTGVLLLADARPECPSRLISSRNLR